jgi:prenyltransferase beta subunit
MSWQLGAFTVLVLALAGGFAWYERSRPDARILALVATLAALAALGRIAFVALPNVKPTTDIVFVSGFALGAAPGFVVGAVAGLVSNFFFGQGPWTVWQMAAWGVTGVLGAGFAVASRGRIRRWPLALVCLVVGYAFAAVQDVGDWVTYSDHSPSQLAVYVGKGTGFDIVHAVGCLIFALAFGPWLARSLVRLRTRLHVTWRPLPEAVAGPLAVVALAAGALAAVGLAAIPSQSRAATGSTAYLLAAQNADGGFGAAPGSPSTQLFAGWAALGLAAEGINPADVHRGGPSLLDYVAGGVASIPDAGSLERTILVARAAGANPASFAGHNLVAQLDRAIRPDGSVADQVNWTAFAILALRAAGSAVPAHTVGWLVRQQNRDGGFGFGMAGGGSDVDDTGAVLQALAGTGMGSASARAVGYLQVAQNHDGGLPSQPGQPSDAQSTAWAVQGLIAAGVSPSGLHRGGAPSPLAYLQGLVAADGHVRYSSGIDQTPVWVTAQAVMALAGRPLPLAPVARASAQPAAAAPSRASAHTSSRGPRGTAHGRARSATNRARSRAARTPSAGLALGPLTAGEASAIMGALTRALSPVGVRPRGSAGP